MDDSDHLESNVFPFDSQLGTLNGVRLHSRANPGSELQAQLKLVPKDSCPLILIGIGLGYHIDLIQEKYPKKRVMVLELHQQIWERSEELQRKILKIHPDTWDFYFWSSLDQIGLLLEIISPHEASLLPSIIALPAYRNLFGSWIHQITSRIQQKRERRSINSATLKRFGKLWLRNTLRNLHYYSHGIPIQKFFQKFDGKPGILLGAGPSLDDLMPWVRDHQDKFVILAVDTALRPVLRFGIRVDFTIILEPQYWNTRHLDFLTNPEVLAVLEISAHPRAFHTFPYPPILSGSTYPLGTFLERGSFARLGAGGSVATSAWDFLHRLGIEEILLAGIDLAFPHLHTHAEGSLSEQLLLAQAHRFHPTETGNFSYLHSGIPLEVLNNEGKPVISDKRMNVYAQWFEFQNTQRKTLRTFTLSRGARALAGIPYLDSEARGKYETYPSISDEIQEILKAYKHSDRNICSNFLIESELKDSTHLELAREVHSSLEDLIEQIDRVIGLSVKALNRLDRYRSRSLTINQLLTFLDAIDEELSALPGKRVFGFLMEDIIQMIQTLPEPESFDVTIDRSQMLYQAFLDSAQWLKTEFRFTVKDF